MSPEEDDLLVEQEVQRTVAEFLEQPLWKRLAREATYAREGVPDNAPTLLLVLCPRCPGRLGTVRGTEDGPLFLGKVVLEATERHDVVRLPVVKLLRRPPNGMPDPDRLAVSCVGEGTCHGRYVLLRHEVLQLANHRNTRKWRPAWSFLVG